MGDGGVRRRSKQSPRSHGLHPARRCRTQQSRVAGSTSRRPTWRSTGQPGGAVPTAEREVSISRGAALASKRSSRRRSRRSWSIPPRWARIPGGPTKQQQQLQDLAAAAPTAAAAAPAAAAPAAAAQARVPAPAAKAAPLPRRRATSGLHRSQRILGHRGPPGRTW